MKLEGIHHITAITGDAPANVRFYAGTLGLRLVKKSVNQDDPTIYHLFYADQEGSPGSDITFFEYPGAGRGRAGAGMVHRIVFRLTSEDALPFWAGRLADAGVETSREGSGLLFEDPEGLGLELRVVETPDAPLIAEHPEIPSELAISGFDGVRVFAAEAGRSAEFLGGTMGFEETEPGRWTARGERRGATYVYDDAPERAGVPGAGTVHHVAWASEMDEHDSWRERVAAGGASVTPVIDRFWFRSIYFREPSGVLFEIATLGPGFGVDEPMESLGQSLVLPPNFEHLREKLMDILTPLPDPRA